MPGTNPSNPSGPAPSAPSPGRSITTRNRYQVYSDFLGSDQVIAQTPYLIPPKAQFNAEIKMSIESLYQIPPGGPPTQTTVENDDFKLAWSAADLTKISANDVDRVRALITIKNNNSWKAGVAAQQALRTNFA